ncbi:MAG: beta-galactosidase GalB, partial [Mucilaginibacter sp.]
MPRLLCMLILLFFCFFSEAQQKKSQPKFVGRERICINNDWRFMRYNSKADDLIYDERPVSYSHNDDIVADTRPSQKLFEGTSEKVLKRWILPTANDFIKDPAKHFVRPAGNPGSNFPFVQKDFNDNNWENVNLPHDWAIKGPFYKEANAVVGGGMGRLPVQGVAWYRKRIKIPATDAGKCIYLDIDGAMSYAMVWLNGNLVGGWPYGYNSFRLDLTPYIKFGAGNQIAIRLDNPANSSRWYPGSGLYRNVWLTKTNNVHVAQWGTVIQTTNVSTHAATVNLGIRIENKGDRSEKVKVLTDVYQINDEFQKVKRIISFPISSVELSKHSADSVKGQVIIDHPALWGPLPEQKPNLYVAVTRLFEGSRGIDTYETRFGIKDIHFDPEKGLIVNGQKIGIQGVNQHSDLGALGSAFNYRAAERQLELLREMGCNAIRLAHNPPAPELLDLTDRMGFMVIDEIFDCWVQGKTPLDFHLIFPDWHEADIRSFIRRDKNHPSVIAWSFGNEVGEQYTAAAGASIASELYAIVKDEDPTRPATASMNYAKPNMLFPGVLDILALNYQGEGIRDAPAYAYLRGIKTPPLYTAFHDKFPKKMVFSSETASTLSSRGTYIFPVYKGFSAPVSDSTGGDPKNQAVSAYELYTAQ